MIFGDLYSEILGEVNRDVNARLDHTRDAVKKFATEQFTETFAYDPTSSDYKRKSEEFFAALEHGINGLTIELRKDGKVRMITQTDIKALVQYDRGTIWFTPNPSAIDQLIEFIFS